MLYQGKWNIPVSVSTGVSFFQDCIRLSNHLSTACTRDSVSGAVELVSSRPNEIWASSTICCSSNHLAICRSMKLGECSKFLAHSLIQSLNKSKFGRRVFIATLLHVSTCSWFFNCAVLLTSRISGNTTILPLLVPPNIHRTIRHAHFLVLCGQIYLIPCVSKPTRSPRP